MNSKTLSKMIEDNKGYRTESFSGSGIKDLEELLYWEISVLGNIDILVYLKENYNIPSDFELDESTINKLKEKAEDEIELKKLIIEEEQKMAILNETYFIDQILNFIEERFGTKDVEAIWLTTDKNVLLRYMRGSDEVIDEYILPKEYIVISDLDIDGALFVYKSI